MAYKKYIKKNGKIYGPYIYHSKRVDGKVVSEYRGLKEGTGKKVNKKTFFFIFAAVALVLFFSLFFSLKPTNISGNVVLNLESQYQEDLPLDGVLSIGLKEGEMIPESSKIIFENAEEIYEYNLSELIQETSFEGDFFVEGQDSFGQGKGYGLIGNKLTYPEVYFKLEIVGEVIEEPIENATNITNTTEENLSIEYVEEILEDIEEVEQDVEEEPEQVLEEPVETTPITGNAIGGFFNSIFNPTGRVISESENQIQTSISYWDEFRYTLKSGQDVKIVPGSVRTETKDLPEDRVQIIKQDNEVIITTDYYEQEQGFGEDYLGEDLNNLEINLSSLNLNFNDSTLKIKLVYEELEFRSFEVDLGESFIEPEEEIPEENVFGLSDQEKNILNKEFGEESVEQTARSYKDWIIVKFKLGEYEVEFSYNKDLSKEELDDLINRDKINWLKDISKELTTEETPSFKLDEFNRNYDIS